MAIILEILSRVSRKAGCAQQWEPSEVNLQGIRVIYQEAEEWLKENCLVGVMVGGGPRGSLRLCWRVSPVGIYLAHGSLSATPWRECSPEMLGRYAPFLTPLKDAAKGTDAAAKSQAMQAIARAARSIPEFIPMTSSSAVAAKKVTSELPDELAVAKLPGVDLPEKEPEEPSTNAGDEEILGPGMSFAELAQKALTEVPPSVQQRIRKLVETTSEDTSGSGQVVAPVGRRGKRAADSSSAGKRTSEPSEVLDEFVPKVEAKPKRGNKRGKGSTEKR